MQWWKCWIRTLHTFVNWTSCTTSKPYASVRTAFGMLNLQVHFILDEMLINGCVVDINQQNVLAPIKLLDRVGKD